MLKKLKCEAGMFLNQYRRGLMTMFLMMIPALYGFLFSHNYRMDTIIKLVSPGDEFNDLELGRFGIVYFTRLFGLRHYNPYLASWLSLIFLLLSSAAFCFLVWKASSGRSGFFGCFLPLVIFLTPNWIEQLFFSYQSFLILLGVLFLTAAVLIAEYADRKRCLAVSVLLTFFSFSFYQAFAPVYPALCIGLVMLRCSDSVTWKNVRIGRSVSRHLFVFFAALAAYFLVNALLVQNAGSTGYLSSQLRWGREPVPGILRSIGLSVWALLSGNGEIETPAYSVSAVCSLLALILYMQRTKDRNQHAALSALWLLLQLTAFAMILVLGGRSYLRTELAVTFIAAFNCMLAVLLAGDCRKTFSGKAGLLPVAVSWAAALFCLYISAGISMRLVYTDDIRSAFDVRLAAEVAAHLEGTGSYTDGKPVVFVGEPEVSLDAGCVKGEAIGRSLFQFVTDEDITNTIISHFMATQGIRYASPGEDDIHQAVLLSEQMNCFPEEGSVLETEHFVAVKFDRDFYYDLQLLEPGLEQSDGLPDINPHEKSVCALEKISADDSKIRLQGFHLIRGIDGRELRNTVYLLSRNTGTLYQVNTACRQRILITRTYWRDGVNYDTAGFTAEFPISLLEQYPGDTFEILVRCEIRGDSFFATTGEMINKRMTDRMAKGIVEEGYVHHET